jgi:hypothetical protein
VFSKNGVKIAKSYDTPDWSAAEAQTEMQQAITALGNNGFAGVYAANDDTGGAAIAAMKSAGIDPATRPTTGQDAELAGIQRILAGTQYMTVYKAVKPEARDAAEMAVAPPRQLPKSGLRDAARGRNVAPPGELGVSGCENWEVSAKCGAFAMSGGRHGCSRLRASRSRCR